jgi:hypothetical protein
MNEVKLLPQIIIFPVLHEESYKNTFYGYIW